MRSTAEVLRDIDRFQPAGGDWRPLDALLDELWGAGVPEAALPALFRVFERFPDEDGAGVLWSIVHGVEHLPFAYEAPLRASHARAPSHMAEVMLDRIARAGPGA